MKKALFIFVLAVVLVFGIAGTAVAEVAHGGFAATSTDCQLCHDVHGAVAGSPALFPDFGTTTAYTDFDDTSDSCMYCHQNGLTNHGAVYGGSTFAAAKSMHLPGFEGTSPDGGLTYGAGEFTCMSCHDNTPHGANYAGTITIAGKEIAYTGDDDTVDEWCGRCHPNNELLDGSTHMTYDAAGLAAYVAVGDCTGCHNSNEFHLYNGGGLFTNDAVVTAFSAGTSWVANDQVNYESPSNWTGTTWVGGMRAPDGYCAICHVESGGNAGVGETF